jgi:hypothetical protein
VPSATGRLVTKIDDEEADLRRVVVPGSEIAGPKRLEARKRESVRAIIAAACVRSTCQPIE